MSPELWAIIGIGVALAGLQWRLYGSLNAGLNARMDRLELRMDRIEADLTSIKERLSRIEGWIAGRFGEEPDFASQTDSSEPHEKPESRVVTGPDELTPPIPLLPENHPKPTDLANMSAPGVPEDQDLASVIAAWPSLSSEVRQCILAIVRGRSAS